MLFVKDCILSKSSSSESYCCLPTTICLGLQHSLMLVNLTVQKLGLGWLICFITQLALPVYFTKRAFLWCIFTPVMMRTSSLLVHQAILKIIKIKGISVTYLFPNSYHRNFIIYFHILRTSWYVLSHVAI